MRPLAGFCGDFGLMGSLSLGTRRCLSILILSEEVDFVYILERKTRENRGVDKPDDWNDEYTSCCLPGPQSAGQGAF